MRKIIVSNLMSLDGYLSGPNGEIDWFINIKRLLNPSPVDVVV